MPHNLITKEIHYKNHETFLKKQLFISSFVSFVFNTEICYLKESFNRYCQAYDVVQKLRKPV